MPAATKRKVTETLPPMHPGEMLREEFLAPLAKGIHGASSDAAELQAAEKAFQAM
jgi:plasmid maintenance system antidote protein VapI